MKFIVFCLVDEIEVKKKIFRRASIGKNCRKEVSIDSGHNWNQEKQVSSKY